MLRSAERQKELVRLYYSGFGPLRQGLVQPFWLEQLDSNGQILRITRAQIAPGDEQTVHSIQRWHRAHGLQGQASVLKETPGTTAGIFSQKSL